MYCPNYLVLWIGQSREECFQTPILIQAVYSYWSVPLIDTWWTNIACQNDHTRDVMNHATNLDLASITNLCRLSLDRCPWWQGKIWIAVEYSLLEETIVYVRKRQSSVHKPFPWWPKKLCLTLHCRVYRPISKVPVNYIYGWYMKLNLNYLVKIFLGYNTKIEERQLLS